MLFFITENKKPAVARHAQKYVKKISGRAWETLSGDYSQDSLIPFFESLLGQCKGLRAPGITKIGYGRPQALPEKRPAGEGHCEKKGGHFIDY